MKLKMSMLVQVFILSITSFQIATLEKNGSNCRSLQREKRAVRTVSSILASIKRFGKCCEIPPLLPAATLQSCLNGKGAEGNGFFGALNAQGGVAPVCYAACVFLELNLINALGIPDLFALPGVFANLLKALDPKWSKVTQDAVAKCAGNLLANPPPLATTVGGKTCPNYPLVFMICVRKIMIFSCPEVMKKPLCFIAIRAAKSSGVLNLG